MQATIPQVSSHTGDALANYSTISSFLCYILSGNCFIGYASSLILEQYVLSIINDCSLPDKPRLSQLIRNGRKTAFPALPVGLCLVSHAQMTNPKALLSHQKTVEIFCR